MGEFNLYTSDSEGDYNGEEDDRRVTIDAQLNIGGEDEQIVAALLLEGELVYLSDEVEISGEGDFKYWEYGNELHYKLMSLQMNELLYRTEMYESDCVCPGDGKFGMEGPFEFDFLFEDQSLNEVMREHLEAILPSDEELPEVVKCQFAQQIESTMTMIFDHSSGLCEPDASYPDLDSEMFKLDMAGLDYVKVYASSASESSDVAEQIDVGVGMRECWLESFLFFHDPERFTQEDIEQCVDTILTTYFSRLDDSEEYSVDGDVLRFEDLDELKWHLTNSLDKATDHWVYCRTGGEE